VGGGGRRTRYEMIESSAASPGAGDRKSPPARQRSSHATLIQDFSARPPRSGRVRPLDAIIVPAGRRAEKLKTVAELAASVDVQLVILASRDCRVVEASKLVASIPGGRAFIVGIPGDYRNDLLTFQTSDRSFADLKAARDSDLSLKRNLSLLLARLMRWEKIMFLDDDIFGVTPTALAKIASQLDSHQVTGLISRSFPDNSVVCHANRLSGRSQDNFVTGAALGVNCAEKPLDFFPDVYNEDWLFFASHAAQGQVISVGTARQQPYKPFADPNRAAMEEFGDLIAEGLYALFNDGQSLDAATTGYWNAFIDARRKLIERLIDDLYLIPTHEAAGQAYESMLHAHKQLALISAAECARFVKAWRDDRGAFARTAKDMPAKGNFAAACEYLRLTSWREAEFGLPDSRRSRQTGAPLPARSKSGDSRSVSA
jgi:hypothetical protein